MNELSNDLDTTPLRDKGFQLVRSFFPEDVRRDLALRAQEILDLREARGLSTDSQDAQGLQYEWFEPILRHPALVELMTRLLGPDVC